MNVINLLYDNPNGTQKFWRGTYDSSKDKVVLEYGRVGSTPHSHVVPPQKFSRPTGREELEDRADKKRKSGYYDATTTQGTEAPRPTTEPAPKSSTPDPRRSELMAALEQGQEAPSWFF